MTNEVLDPILPDEREYPEALRARFELLECFSAKADTQTLLARDRTTGTLCVVKCCLKGGLLYDHAEPDALKALDAPPLPRFVAEYTGEDMRCVLREYVPGQSLAEAAAHRRFSEDEIIAIGGQLCDQLASLHGLDPPVIHRDIKPQNVVLRQGRHPGLRHPGLRAAGAVRLRPHRLPLGRLWPGHAARMAAHRRDPAAA